VVSDSRMQGMNYTQQPPSKRELKAAFIEGNRDQCPAEMLYCGAYLILEMDDPGTLLNIGLEYLANTLEACRADGGFLTPTDPRYSPLTVYYNTRFNPPECDRMAYPNRAHVFQRSWRQASPVTCDDVYTSELLHDNRRPFAAINSRSILFQRLTFERQPVGMTCIDFARDTHHWTTDEAEFVRDFCNRLLGPLAGLSRYWAQSRPDRPSSKPSEAELAVIRLAAAGHSYKVIADRLNKSVRTVENQLRQARQRLQAANISELINKCQYWL